MMNRISRFALALAIIPGLVTPVAAAAADPVPDDASLVAEARAIVDSYREPGWFSGSVMVAKAGKPIYRAAVGLADRESAAPNRLDTRYALGSIIKDFTAVLVLQHVERGVIGLDDDLHSFGLGFPADTARKITVRHLLEHRSGFPGAYPAEYRESPLSFPTVDDRLALLRDAPLLFEPGTDRRYSNYGYVVLGAILEKATGASFSELLRKNVFDPLKLEDTVYPYRDDAPNQSLRYTFNHAREQVAVGVTEHHGPDGGIESTVTDVLAFYRALFYGGELISRETRAATGYFPTDGAYWASFGGGTGVSSAVELDLASDYQVVVLANTDGLVAEEITGRICSYIRTGAYDPIKLPPVVFAWETYLETGADAFAADFPARYASAGYDRFIGRTLNELGMSLLDDAKWKDAFAVFGALVDLFPEAPQAYDSLAYARLRSGDAEQARDSFSTALELQPGFSSDYSPDNYGHPAVRQVVSNHVTGGAILNLKSFLLGLAAWIGAAHADAAEYPMLDGRCDEYRPLGAEVIAEGDDIPVLLFQDADYVWLCYPLPEESYGTLDLVLDSPGLAGPVNLHVSAQLGEWPVGHTDEAPQSADSDRWWKVNGWWSNAVSWNGTRETDRGPRPNFQASEGRELQLSKKRFGRGTWRLGFSIEGVRNADGGLEQVVLPSNKEGTVTVEIF